MKRRFLILLALCVAALTLFVACFGGIGLPACYARGCTVNTVNCARRLLPNINRCRTGSVPDFADDLIDNAEDFFENIASIFDR